MTALEESGGRTVEITYNDSVVRKFVLATVLWGVVGMLVGVIVALQLAWWPANVHSMLSFGRLRPLHTNAVIFAFVGNMVFAGIYHSSQRLLKARMASDLLSNIHFWGWQLIIVSAALTLPMGFSAGKEYAELEWPIDIAIALVWVVFALNFFWTLAKRREKHLYVAIWFYIASIVTVAILHIVNSIAIPVFALKSYSVYGGAQDALVQWWYGHNAVAFFLTTPVLGIMYYYVPKAIDRPVYSYRLSIVHFWALIFLYIWAGPHHLLNTALPDWAQTLGMIFSVMLWAPSWGGMVNGLLTMRGAWDKVRTDPVLKFFGAGITFYGMATFEGPLLSVKSVSGLAHYTDWIIGHVHSGALGWNGFMAAGMIYWLLPRLWGRKLHSEKLADLHFWLGTFGIILYVISMWVSGINQGMMWRAENPDGSLMYPTFLETAVTVRPMYWMRLIGGSMYLVGFLLMGYNVVKTVVGAPAVDATVKVVEPPPSQEVAWAKLVFAKPVLITVVVCAVAGAGAMSNLFVSPLLVTVAFIVAITGAIALQAARKKNPGEPTWHRLLEGRALIFTVFAAIAVLVGGVAELVPSLTIKPAEIAGKNDVRPYLPLELEGRDVYIREGCYTCHSQMIRPMRFESNRYGEVSTLSDSMYDHPFQWGSKRSGPDLAREGGKYPNLWHAKHMVDPRSISEGSNMPPYAHLVSEQLDLTRTVDKVAAMKAIGVPYTQNDIATAELDARAQGEAISKDLKANGFDAPADSRLVALIAYLQRIGKPQPAPITKPKDAVSLGGGQ
ncbi:MAG: cytochrome-c oxidase, cbb3-type subunit I [Myxococcales bacterium]|jgi:cytochrome c oxidase cbb3-type subunit I/II|nr:cytochrome-c oxidase, cbb3-type subunit I [Myxococcales bacterium]